MSDQHIHSKISDAARLMHIRAISLHLENLNMPEPAQLPPRLSMNTQKEYRRALFQAALSGNIHTLEALSTQIEATQSLIDQDSCDNALWVAVAEQQTDFAIRMLQTQSIKVKITLPGVKEAMKLSLEHKDQQLTKALLQFVAESNDENTLEIEATPIIKPAC